MSTTQNTPARRYVALAGLLVGTLIVLLTAPRPSAVSSGLRKLTTTSNTVVPTDPSFAFDGTTSDLAQQFYRRHVAGVVVSKLAYKTTDLPSKIQDRLSAVGLTFEQLPGLLQRALVWDAGYAFDPDGLFIKIYTKKGVAMDQIAISFAQYNSSGCTATNCTDPDGLKTYRSKTCSGTMMLSVSHCASESVETQGGHMSMWATGGDPDAVPALNIERHYWYDEVYLQDYLVFAVHTTSDENEPAWDVCPSSGVYGSIIIPCQLYSESQAASMTWEDPSPGPIVTPWLMLTKEQQARKFPLVCLIPIIVAAMGLGAATFQWFLHRRRRQQLQDKLDGSSSLENAFLPPVSSKNFYQQTESVLIFHGHAYSSVQNSAMRLLQQDDTLRSHTLPLSEIVFERELAKGSYGEVWLCQYQSTHVAVKRLLKSKQRTFADVQLFAEEIQRTASLHHPNIVRFVGVAWNALEDLCMAMEYLSRGDLKAHLLDNGERLSWSRDKLQFALGIARAMQYLHARSPPMIHRDLKARNVLLTDEFEAKLIDFGVSRNYREYCMTVGVGTPYWAAPEVLEGTKYSERSDIYSFGVVLSEIDTCQAPYCDVKTSERGTKMQPFLILTQIMAGELQPTFTDDCPAFIRQLGDRCLDHDPSVRPSAEEIVGLLETWQAEYDFSSGETASTETTAAVAPTRTPSPLSMRVQKPFSRSIWRLRPLSEERPVS